MKIAVAGSDGFVGRYVCSTISRYGHDIISLDLANGFDLSEPDSFNKVPKVDCFIHLANLVYIPGSYEAPSLYYRVNFMTTLNALEVCRKYHAHLVFVSSYIYGVPQYLPVDENHPISPFNPYAQTKVICEKLCEGYYRDFGVSVSIIRPFNIYGIGQKGKLLIPEIISQLKDGKETIQLKAESPRRDYVNVIDVAEAISLCALRNDGYDIFNVCTGESFSVREITEIINRHLKRKVQFLFSESDRRNEVSETRGNCNKLRAIGWNPTCSFEDGIIQILKSENL